ncbi:MAG: winged helix-turn-helix transcriptional regulator [Coriobacteriaceae bacterium]|nr:winged helix-turn-helix transcriptional regulator [Coriobacteriaceae bacterium]
MSTNLPTQPQPLQEPHPDEVCTRAIIHEDTLQRARLGLTDDTTLSRASELFKALSDPSRLRIINALLLEEMCVCDVAELLQMSQPAVSHHLRVLRQSQLVKHRRDGKVVFYSLDDEHVHNIFYQGLAHAGEQR